MTPQPRHNLVIGLVFVGLALLAALVWIPLDTDTGIIEKVRGRQNIGDAMAPTVACGFLILGGVLLILTERRAPDQPVLRLAQLGFISRILAVIITGLVVMRYTGPAVAELINLTRAEPIEYRVLRASLGWKHLGFALGGTFIVAGMIAIVERGLTRRAVFTGLLAVALMIAVFDLPFEDLLLPPNGDV